MSLGDITNVIPALTAMKILIKSDSVILNNFRSLELMEATILLPEMGMTLSMVAVETILSKVDWAMM